LTVTCPNGHQSATTDYCDQCGAPIQAAPTAPPSTAEGPGASAAGGAPGPHRTATLDAVSSGDEVDTSPATRQEPCPQCGAPRTGDGRYCEGCGYDFVAAPPVTGAPDADAGPADAGSGNGPAPAAAVGPVAAWEAVSSADRAQFDRLAPAGLEFPTEYPERHFPLTGKEVVIGRTHPPDQPPDINLAGAPEDPAVSHRHALLERQGDGSYKLRDLGSTNGTTLNDDPTPISRDVGAGVTDGDRIHLGAWTTLTVRRKS